MENSEKVPCNCNENLTVESIEQSMSNYSNFSFSDTGEGITVDDYGNITGMNGGMFADYGGFNNTGDLGEVKIDRAQFEFMTQGIHGLEEYDRIASLDIYPINLLSNEAKREFGNGLFFAGPPGKEIIVGWKRGMAYKELTNIQFVNLIQLLAGMNPIGPSYFSYKPNPSLPQVPTVQNMRPCFRDFVGCLCKVDPSCECVFIRIRDVVPNI